MKWQNYTDGEQIRGHLEVRGDEEEGVDVKHEWDLCTDGIVLCLDHGGGYTNIHVIKCHRTVDTRYAHVNFLVLILCYSYVRCDPGENGERVWGTSLYYLCNHLWIYKCSKIKLFSKAKITVKNYGWFKTCKKGFFSENIFNSIYLCRIGKFHSLESIGITM